MKKWIWIGAVAVVVIFFYATYNGFVNKEEGLKGAWADVETQYQRRADLIPNLVSTVKGYAAHETQTLNDVTEARARATSINLSADDLTPEKLAQFQQAQAQVRSALGRLIAVSESYPDLKANRNFLELLERAPGVWIDGEKISINGKSGSKIYVNDRELRMEPEQLLTYLRSLRAEEIRKIEVVPVTGADYDADSAGGVIRITLKKRRENGIDGSVAYNTTQSGITDRHNPSTNINVHSGRADLYASAWGSFGSDRTITDEQTLYNAADKSLNARSEMKGRTRSFGASTGTVVEIAPRHSIGAEFEYWRNRDGEPNDTYTDFRTADETVRTESRFDNRNHRDNYSATFNYIWKIDTLGSTLKLLADYTRRETDTRNDNESRITAPGSVLDSVYRDNATSLYDIAAATLALEKHFSPRWSLKAGAKYTRNDMRNDALYEYRRGDAWLRNERQSFTINYTENIAAAYAIASAKLGAVSFVAGVRGEYTRTTGKGVGQDYFSFFPNASLSWTVSSAVRKSV